MVQSAVGVFNFICGLCAVILCHTDTLDSSDLLNCFLSPGMISGVAVSACVTSP